MLSKTKRFHGHGSLRYIYKNAASVRSHLCTIRYTKNRFRRSPRIAVVVSKKVHKSAVGRNRIRRRVYETMRYELPHLNGVYDIAIIVTNAEVRTMPHEELVATIHDLLLQENIIKPYKSAP